MSGGSGSHKTATTLLIAEIVKIEPVIAQLHQDLRNTTDSEDPLYSKRYAIGKLIEQKMRYMNDCNNSIAELSPKTVPTTVQATIPVVRVQHGSGGASTAVVPETDATGSVQTIESFPVTRTTIDANAAIVATLTDVNVVCDVNVVSDDDIDDVTVGSKRKRYPKKSIPEQFEINAAMNSPKYASMTKDAAGIVIAKLYDTSTSSVVEYCTEWKREKMFFEWLDIIRFYDEATYIPTDEGTTRKQRQTQAICKIAKRYHRSKATIESMMQPAMVICILREISNHWHRKHSMILCENRRVHDKYNTPISDVASNVGAV